MNIYHSQSNGRVKPLDNEKSWDIPARATVHSSLSSDKIHTISQCKIVRRALIPVLQNPHSPEWNNHEGELNLLHNPQPSGRENLERKLNCHP